MPHSPTHFKGQWIFDEIMKHNRNLTDMHKTITQQCAKLDTVDEVLEDIKDTLMKLNEEDADLVAQIDDCKGTIGSLTSENKTLRREKERFKELYQNLRFRLQQAGEARKQ